jgi:hypothetical protein
LTNQAEENLKTKKDEAMTALASNKGSMIFASAKILTVLFLCSFQLIQFFWKNFFNGFKVMLFVCE